MLRKIVSLAAVVAAVVIGYRSYAVGTTAGTSITNQAYADYKDANGNSLPRVYSNTVTTVVSQVAGVDLVPPTATASGQNGHDTMFLFQIFNTGNGPDTFDFTTALAAGSAWTPTNVRLFYDANNNHVFEPGTDTLIGSGAGPFTTGVVQPDDDYDVFMFVTIPDSGTAPDATQSTMHVSATSHFNGAVHTDPLIGNYTTVVAAAVIAAQKTISPASPKPGDVVTYTITMVNSGTAPGTVVVLSDPVPANLTYKPGSITLGGVGKTDLNDADEANFGVTTPNVVTVAVGTIAAGGSAVVVFQATVDAGRPAGSTVTNQATVTYTSGMSSITVTSNGATFFVGQATSVSLESDRSSTTDPGSTVTYPFTLTNNGNDTDVIDLTYTSSAGLTWVVWVDANGDGIAGNDGDYKLTDTDADGRIDTDSLAQGQSLALLAVVTVPAGTADQTHDTTVFTGTSSNSAGTSDTVTFATTVTAPVLAVTKTVSPLGNRPPGTVLTYTVTVTNNGTGNATAVVATDMIPQFTTFVLSSIKTGSSAGSLNARSDASEGDGASFDGGSGAVISDSSALGPGGTLVMQFQVTID